MDHLLVQLAEEAAEVAQEAAKCFRFGPAEVYAPAGISNAERVAHELCDLIALVELLQAEGVLPAHIFDNNRIAAKKVKVEKMLFYSHTVGRL